MAARTIPEPRACANPTRSRPALSPVPALPSTRVEGATQAVAYVPHRECRRPHRFATVQGGRKRIGSYGAPLRRDRHPPKPMWVRTPIGILTV
jgi:hypothetical protein